MWHHQICSQRMTKEIQYVFSQQNTQIHITIIKDYDITLCYKLTRLLTYHKMSFFRTIGWHDLFALRSVMCVCHLFICTIFIDYVFDCCVVFFTLLFSHVCIVQQLVALISKDALNLVFRVYYLYNWSLYLWCQSSGKSTLFWKKNKNDKMTFSPGQIQPFEKIHWCENKPVCKGL